MASRLLVVAYSLYTNYLELVTKGHIAMHTILLNQAHTWFLKIDPVRIVGIRACVCPRPRLLLLITSGIMLHDMKSILLVKQVLQLLYGNCSWYR